MMRTVCVDLISDDEISCDAWEAKREAEDETRRDETERTRDKGFQSSTWILCIFASASADENETGRKGEEEEE